MSDYLKSSDPDFNPDEICECFGALYGGDVDAFYEHGQWWVTDSISGRTYSVVDAVGHPSSVCGGLSFEELG